MCQVQYLIPEYMADLHGEKPELEFYYIFTIFSQILRSYSEK